MPGEAAGEYADPCRKQKTDSPLGESVFWAAESRSFPEAPLHFIFSTKILTYVRVYDTMSTAPFSLLCTVFIIMKE